MHVLSLNQGPEEYDWTTFRSGEGVGANGSCYPKDDMDGGAMKGWGVIFQLCLALVDSLFIPILRQFPTWAKG